MKQQKKKKPTMKEVEKVVGSLINESQLLRLSLMKTQEVLSSYIEYKKDTDKFAKHLEVNNDKRNEQNKRDNKNSSKEK